jgi:four helix bundle protein
MPKIRSFEDLEVWQAGKRLALLAYQLTAGFPSCEIYGLTSQIRRAAVSVPANVAEGFGRFHYGDKIRFFLHARGSLNEMKSHFLIAQELGYLDRSKLDGALQSVDSLGVKLNNLINACRRQKSEIG